MNEIRQVKSDMAKFYNQAKFYDRKSNRNEKSKYNI